MGTAGKAARSRFDGHLEFNLISTLEKDTIGFEELYKIIKEIDADFGRSREIYGITSKDMPLENWWLCESLVSAAFHAPHHCLCTYRRRHQDSRLL